MTLFFLIRYHHPLDMVLTLPGVMVFRLKPELLAGSYLSEW